LPELLGGDKVGNRTIEGNKQKRESKMIIIKIILAFFLPPVAAFLQVGISTHFWINIILTILGGIPGVIHALWLVLSGKKA
jgi:uncharacterized membrane protein YqaE (UPF0057 family)